MKKWMPLMALLFILNSCDSGIKYPQTEKIPVVDTYFDTEIIDNYRWLEDDLSPETAQWVEQQNKTTFGFLDNIPFRNQIQQKLEQVWDYEKVGTPFDEGNYTYFYKNDGLQDQYVLYRTDDQGDTEVFLDPNTFSEDGTTSLAGLSFSDNGQYAAYAISEGGSDWRKLIVIETETKKQIGDTLQDIKFSGIDWKLNDGFFYSSYDKPDGSELSDLTDTHKLYYHQMGQPQSQDQVIFGEKENEKHRYVGSAVSEDGSYLIIEAAKTTTGNKLFLKELNQENAPLVSMVDDYQANSYLLDSNGDTLYIVTDLDAPNRRLVEVNAQNPHFSNWTDLIPETKNVLNVSTGANHLFARYTIDVLSRVYVYDYQGNNLKEVELPGLGRVSGFGGDKEDDIVYYSFTNYHTPSSTYSYHPSTDTSELYWSPDIDFDPTEYTSSQIFYESLDGTQIPMIITHKKSVTYDGTNPTILYGYGGFNISMLPSFGITNAVWMDLGGVYAVPNIRGGGEYGRDWHAAGTKFNKQNVFDDFIAAAEYLINQNITSPDFLAIRGGSNGGLLVGAVMTQRPELMKVAIPAVGVLDMLRYHQFTSGAGWAYDFGTSEESQEMFDYLLGYSPLHNLVEGTNYPATLITTADHDDRVVPAHSFKFAATLQEKHQGDHPVLIRIETDAGHGAGTPVSKRIEQTADIFAFILYNMGIHHLETESIEF
ncbi:MAG: prolyl oligopeptidase family serine peptidase [Flavobacteriaceae bacterium]|nr:prolyl oligopeptidase family serine peptidase [Flavobacteriaceae bacterium]MCY4267621.1 prolyl oligopeptidase family serine peptidase [Flavobacteriaceae bacterium]